ncbi:MAG: DNA topoisomerase 3 [Selenomonadaceae bacterium]
MRLYIAEKPSMGREIAKCLPGPARSGNGYIETKGGVVTWGFGHILRQFEPQDYDERYKKWRAEDLPIVPAKWQLMVDPAAKKQFEIIKGLIAKADEIVNAGDPDREGQLLIDEVLDYVGNTKPVLRILLNALDEKSIKEANADLRDNHDFVHLKESALARSRADWLIGMNLSRAYTLAARRSGHKVVLPIGRVKTPTLALVVRREREIKNFKPVAYYIIKADFAHENGTFRATWKPSETERGIDPESRLIDKAVAEEKLRALADAAANGERGIISSYTKQKKQEQQRLPFSLSTLQVLAGKRFGYEPQQVLDTAQKLYEKKLTSYPRSDCEYLPKNQIPASKTILQNLTGIDDAQLSQWANGADQSIRSRAWNDKKITAHHAIIPTTVRVNLASLTPMERNIYFLVAQAYLAQFYPVHVYDQTKIDVDFANEKFTASGRTVRDMGWKALYASAKRATKNENDDDENDSDDDASATLPLMKKNDSVTLENTTMDEKETKPPSRFTPSTLLQGMKEIHKYVKDETLKKKLRETNGIGTEATRATIIDDLIKRKFMTTTGKKKYLSPTPAADMLIDVLPDDMTYPDKTAVWEEKLHAMAEGDGTIDAFLGEQITFAKMMCEKATDVKMAAASSYECPRCHKGVLEKRHGKKGDFWGCTNFPRCRLTTNDIDGKPDMALAMRKANANGNSFTMSAQDAADFQSFQSYPREINSFEDYMAMRARDTNNNSRYRGQSSSGYKAAESKSTYRHGGQYKKQPSAMPMEKLARANDKTTGASDILCPHCREGHLRRINGRNGYFWGCTNYPRCTATYDDNNGSPVLK